MSVRALPDSWSDLPRTVRDAVLKALIEKRRLSADTHILRLTIADRSKPLAASLEQAFFLRQQAKFGGDLAWTMAAPPIILDAVNLEKVSSALEALAARHDVLHMLFRPSADHFELVPDGGRALAFSTRKLPVTVALTGAENWIRRRYQEILAEPFDTENGPLWRAELCTFAGRGVILLSFCSAIVDGDSLYLIDRDLRALLAASVGDVVPKPAFDFADYASTQAQMMRAGRFDGTLDWWRERLAGGPPAAWSDGRQAIATSSLYEQVISPETGRLLNAYAAAKRTTPPVVLLAEYMALLHEIDGIDDLWVTAATATRDIAGTEAMVGTFARQTLMRYQWPTNGDALAGVHALLAETMEQLPVPHLLVRQYLEKAYPDAPSAFRYVFNHRLVPPAPSEDEPNADIAFRPGPKQAAAAREEDILFMVMQSGEQRLMHWYLRDDRFSPQEAERLLLRFKGSLDRRLGL